MIAAPKKLQIYQVLTNLMERTEFFVRFIKDICKPLMNTLCYFYDQHKTFLLEERLL